MVRAVVWSLAACAWLAGTCAAAPTLVLHYQDRAPYSSLEADGRVGGLVATPAARALDRAGIAYQWQLTPAQRQLALIQQGNALHCGVGWFRTPEREAFGRYSAPLHRDRPFVALARADAVLPAEAGAARAADLLGAMAARLLVKHGYSYGATLDALIARAPAPVLRAAADVAAMARMVAAGRADWMIVSPEEAPALVAAGGAALRVLRLTDVGDGATRHLYCSRAVPSEWLARIDHALGAP